MPTERVLLLLGVVVGMAGGATPGAAQQAAGAPIVYEREVFTYAPGNRPDPFRSLLLAGELGIRVEDLSLRGVVFHTDPARSVAVLARSGSERRLRVRVGDRIGGLRVVAIGPRSVDILIEELGVTRRERLEIRRETETDRS